MNSQACAYSYLSFLTDVYVEKLEALLHVGVIFKCVFLLLLLLVCSLFHPLPWLNDKYGMLLTNWWFEFPESCLA